MAHGESVQYEDVVLLYMYFFIFKNRVTVARCAWWVGLEDPRKGQDSQASRTDMATTANLLYRRAAESRYDIGPSCTT